MVELGKSSPTEELRGAIDQALRSGMNVEAIAHMVAERALTLNELATDTLADDTLPADEGVVTYDVLPPGLIDLPSASRKYGVNGSTLRTWVNTGRVRMLARKKAPSAGGGYVAVSDEELRAYINSPRNKGGRPRKRRK